MKKKKGAGPRLHLVDAWTLEAAEYPRSLDWSADGELVALGAADGSLRFLDSARGTLLRTKSSGGGLTCVRWNPRQRLLAAASEDGACRVWQGSGELVAELPGKGGGWVEHVAWSPDGERLAIASGRTARVFTPSGEPVLETEAHPSTVTGLEWSPRGDALATICYGGVHLWPLVEGSPARHLPWKGSLISLAWSPDGEVIACGSQDCSVHFWRLGSGKDSEMTGYPAKPRELAWSKDSRLLATSGGAAICVWRFEGDGPEGTKPLLLKGHEDLLTALDFGGEALTLASGSKDRDVLLWRPGVTPKPVGLARMKDEVVLLRFSPDGRRLAAADATGHLEVWRVAEARVG
ncbi:WD40 repeat domain-containing protein [Myxococcus sp. RHSTA-1-4]|uniref:WD40 repeat domain-containing protein n=1 Tax=Myxococcus sp. RHSTA-1-4 TaxID=2874601 RepID=UPI001CBD4898|nr:WD40 repeat domain-containing protein [Myxococcus sp. RHSTA-1-4]